MTVCQILLTAPFFENVNKSAYNERAYISRRCLVFNKDFKILRSAYESLNILHLCDGPDVSTSWNCHG